MFALKFEILNPKHEMVRQAHHPEPCRRANSKSEFSNVQNFKSDNNESFWSFAFGTLEIVSKLGPRPKGGESGGPISKFGFRIFRGRGEQCVAKINSGVLQ